MLKQEHLDALSVGKTLWTYDKYDRRRIPMEYPITAETTRSWIVGPSWHERKVPKRVPKGQNGIWGWYATLDDVERERWCSEHGYAIGNAVSRLRDYELLKKIAKLVGYDDSRR